MVPPPAALIPRRGRAPPPARYHRPPTAPRLFTLLSALSLLLWVAMGVLGGNASAVNNGHLEVYVFGRPAGELIAWFLFGDELLHQTPLELVRFASMFLPLLWVACTVVRTAQGLLHHQRAARLLREGRCPQCGYDLRATPGRCPECGTAAAGKGA